MKAQPNQAATASKAEGTLEERYEKALLAVHKGVHSAQKTVDAIEAEMAEREFEQRRLSVLDAALAKANAIEEDRLAKAAEQERLEKRMAARLEVDASRGRLIAASKAWALAANEMMRLGVDAENLSLHDEAADILRGQVLKHARDPFGRRLLGQLGRPLAHGGGSIA